MCVCVCVCVFACVCVCMCVIMLTDLFVFEVKQYDALMRRGLLERKAKRIRDQHHP